MTNLIRSIIRMIKKRLANAQLKARLLAALAFAVFAYLGANDATDVARQLSNPDMMAQRLGITIQESTFRAVGLMVLSGVITLASLATMVGAIQRTTLLRGWIVVTAAYVLYGLFHLGIAVILLKGTRAEAFLPVANLLLAAAAYSFGRQASRALDPVVH
jgi:branched-subunit amino acid permease